jgi:hypothetical protein
MNEKKIHRRQMIKVGSLAGLSNLIYHPSSPAKSYPVKLMYPDLKIPGSDTDICYLSALEMSSLLRAKKISARN